MIEIESILLERITLLANSAFLEPYIAPPCGARQSTPLQAVSTSLYYAFFLSLSLSINIFVPRIGIKTFSAAKKKEFYKILPKFR